MGSERLNHGSCNRFLLSLSRSHAPSSSRRQVDARRHPPCPMPPAARCVSPSCARCWVRKKGSLRGHHDQGEDHDAQIDLLAAPSDFAGGGRGVKRAQGVGTQQPTCAGVISKTVSLDCWPLCSLPTRRKLSGDRTVPDFRRPMREFLVARSRLCSERS